MREQSQYFNLLDLVGVAAMLGVSTKILCRLINEGQIPAFKVGNLWWIRKSQLKQWIQEQEKMDFFQKNCRT